MYATQHAQFQELSCLTCIEAFVYNVVYGHFTVVTVNMTQINDNQPKMFHQFKNAWSTKQVFFW